MNNIENYNKVVNDIIDAGRGLGDIDPQIFNMFIDSINTFNSAVKTVYIDRSRLDTKDYKIKVIEKMFNIDIEKELSKMVEDIVTNGFDNSNDINNIKNVDEDLLANIKKNIQNYLKD